MTSKEIKKILIAGDPFRDYIKQIARGFKDNGINVILLQWNKFNYGPIVNGLRFCSRKWRYYYYLKEEKYNSLQLENHIRKNKINILLVMNGVRLTKNTIDLCKKNGIIKILWAYDNIDGLVQRCPINVIEELASNYDLIYTYERNDLPFFSKFAKSQLLHVGYDPSLYYPLNNIKKRIDICFVGSVRRTLPERKQTLKLIVSNFKNALIEVYTDKRIWYSPFHLEDILFKWGKNNLIMRMGTISHNLINKIYNETKICLNIHRSISKYAINPRNFEILGSGGFLLSDRKLDEQTDIKNGVHYVHYNSIDDLLIKLRSYLEKAEERQIIAQNGMQLVKKNHTYKIRAQTILKNIL